MSRIKIIDDYLAPYQRKVRVLISKPDFIALIRENLYIDQDLPTNEIAFLYVNNIEERPVCRFCNGRVNWFGSRYAETCSRSCETKHRQTPAMEKFRQFKQSPESIAKAQQTIRDRYGDHPNKDRKKNSTPEQKLDTNEKIKTVMLDRYGVENCSQLLETKKKVRDTRLARLEQYRETQLAKNLATTQGKVGDSEIIHECLLPNRERGEANIRYDMLCKQCGEKFIIPSETLKFRVKRTGKSCPICSGIATSRSIAENEIAALFNDPDRNNRSLINPYELDIVLHAEKIAIEYCGIFWHSERAGKQSWYHAKKLNLCRAQGYRLFTIFEDEWVNKRPLVESMLANALGQNSTKINARSCSVEIINSKTGNQFFERNHIQGRGRANVYYGLFHRGELVSVMSFSNNELSRRSRGWDINRFCSQRSTTIRGAAGKLFRAFVKDNDPQQVVSYADLRWGTGNVYGSIGFKQVDNTVPNYWYFRNGEIRRYHRFGLRKNSSDNPNMTEWQSRQEQGWNRIWDCGNAKWVWTKP